MIFSLTNFKVTQINCHSRINKLEEDRMSMLHRLPKVYLAKVDDEGMDFRISHMLDVVVTLQHGWPLQSRNRHVL